MVRSWGAAAVAALLLACLLCLSLLAHFSDADTVHEERRQQEMMASFTARALGLRIETYQRVLQSMGHGVHSSMLDTPYLLELLLREDAGYAGIFDSLVMTGSDGSLVSYTPSGRSPFAGSALRDALRRTLSDGKPQVTYLSEETGDTHLGLLLTVPLRQANGTVRGALAGWVRVSMSSLLPQSEGEQRGASFMLVDADDKLLAHSQGGYAAEDIAQVLGHYGARWPTLSSTSTSNADSQRWGHLLVTRVGMPLPRWQVVVVNDMSTRLLGMQRLTAMQWFGLVAIALLIALALLALLWWLSRPLSQLLSLGSSHDGHGTAAMPRLHPALRGLHDKNTAPEDAEPDEAQRIQQHWQSLERRRHASEHQLQSVESSLAQMLEAMPQGAVWAQGSVLHYASRRAGDLLGKDRQSLQPLHLNQLLQNQPQARAWAQSASQSMASFGHCRGELQWQLEGGAVRWLHVEGQQLQAPAQGSLWLIDDAQHRRHRHNQSHWQATHDALTGALLPAALRERADGVRRAQGRGEPAPAQAVLWVDVDYFAVLNATAGRAAGDEVLRQVTWLLRKEQGRHGLLARMGDDDFALWYSQAPDAATVQALAWRLCDAVRAWSPEFAGQRFVLGLSIGWLHAEHPTGELPAMLHAAEQACRGAKHAGQGCAVQAYFQAAPSS